jgi:sirohydrochlorin cobaltochelatase
LVLCAHGVDGGPGVAAGHADALRRRGLFADVVACCLNGAPSLIDTVRRIDSDQITVVPTLMASGVTAQRLFSEAAIDSRVTVTAPVGTHSAVPDLISASAHHACQTRGWAPSDADLVLVGHGTSRDANSGRALVRQQQCLTAEAGFRAVRVAFLEQAPRFEAVLAGLDRGPAVVVGCFADHGVHGETDLRRLVAAVDRNVCYAGPIGVEPGIREIIVDLARGAAKRAAARSGINAVAPAIIAPPGSPPVRGTPPARPA